MTFYAGDACTLETSPEDIAKLEVLLDPTSEAVDIPVNTQYGYLHMYRGACGGRVCLSNVPGSRHNQEVRAEILGGDAFGLVPDRGYIVFDAAWDSKAKSLRILSWYTNLKKDRRDEAWRAFDIGHIEGCANMELMQLASADGVDLYGLAGAP